VPWLGQPSLPRSQTLVPVAYWGESPERPQPTSENGGWDAPHRVLRHKAVAEWEAAGYPAPGQRPGEGTIIGTAPRGDKSMTLVRYAATSYPSIGFRDDIDYTVLYAGESCHLINDIKPAAQIVHDMMREAADIIEHLPRG